MTALILDTGAGIEAAVAGAEVIVHCAGAQKGDADKARTLVRAASAAGTPHLVNISVVGADRVPQASRPGSWSSHSGRHPGWRPTSPGRAVTR